MALDDLNAFADQVSDGNRDKTLALLNLQNVAGANADAYAGSLGLSRHTQVPPAWSTPELRADAERRAVAFDPAVADMPPVTARFFANPGHAALAHDDVGTFRQIEELARNGFGSRNDAPLSPGGSRSTLQFGTDRDRAEANYFGREYGTKPFRAIQGGLGKLATRLAFPAAAAVDAVNGDDYYKEFASQLYDRFSRIQEGSAADPSQTFGGRVVRSVEELVPLVLSGGFGLAGVVGQATNDTYDGLTARGVDPDTSLALAMKSGMTAYAMTKLPFGGASLSSSLVRGATLNPLFGALDRGLEKAGLNYAGYGKQADDIDPLDPGTMAHDLAMGLLFGAHHALQTGRPMVGDSLMESLVPFYDHYRAGRRADALAGIGAAVRDSKANNRAPELVRRHLDGVAAEHAGIDNAYVPVERWNDLFRSAGLDPSRVAAENLANPEAYREALATGSDIVIPFGEFTGTLSRLEQYGELVKDTRLSPGDSTQREASARVQAVKENAHKSGGFVDALKNMIARSQEAVKGNESYNKVYDDLVSQQMGIGMERSTAEHNASLVANAFRVMGERAGVDPYELYSHYNLKLARPLGSDLAGRIGADASIDQMLEHLREGDIPKQSDDHLELIRLKDHLDRSGIDLNSMDNRQVRDRLKGQQELWQSEEHQEKVRTVQSAIDKILNGSEEGTAYGLRPDLEQYGGSSDVSFLWGDEKKGIRHIGEKRGADVVWQVIQTVISGKVTKFVKGKKNVHIVDGDREAVLSLEEHGQQKTWLLTGWKIGEPDASGEVSTQSGATQARPTFSRSDLGAGSFKYPATSRAESILSTLDSTAKTDGGNGLSIVGAPEDVKKLYQAGHKPVAVLTGKELGEFGDIKELRKAAFQWYRDNLHGKPVERNDLGSIAFTRKGIEEFSHFGADPAKIKMVTALRDIIRNGDYIETQNLDHPRRDGIIKFHVIEADVRLEGEIRRSRVFVGEDRRGNKFYELFPDAKENDRNRNRHRGPEIKSDVAAASLEGETTLNQSISDTANGVNIQFVQPGKDNVKRGLTLARPMDSALDGDKSAHEFWQTKYGADGVSSFGPVWRDLKHDALRAVERLAKYRTGEAIAALHHPEVGDIDLVWGKEGSLEKEYEDGFGFAKIRIKHPEVAGDLQNILDTTSVVSRGKNRIRLESDQHRAVVRLDWDGEGKQWLLTEFEKEKEPGTGKRTGASSSDEPDSPIHQALTDFIIDSKSRAVNALFQSAVNRLAADEVRELYQSDKHLIEPAGNESERFGDDSASLRKKSSKRGAASKVTGRSEAPGEDATARGRGAAPTSGDADIRALNDAVGREETSASGTPANNDYIKKVVTGVLHSAITRIKTPADAAHIAFPLTKRAQEAAIAIVTDAKGNVLGIIQHSTGAMDSTSISPRDLLGVVHDFPGAAEVWFAHNHPNGDPTPSPPDHGAISLLTTLLDGSGIKSRGMVVVGQTEGAVWMEGKDNRSEKIPLSSLQTDKERTQKIKTYDREIVALPTSEQFAYIEHVIEYARSHGEGVSGVIVVDSSARPVSLVPMSVSEMAKLKTGNPASGSSAIMSAFHKGNGVAMVLVIPGLPGSLAAARNMISFGSLFGAPLLDVIEMKNGISFVESGRMPEGVGHFFQSADAPASHDFVPAPDGRYVFGEITPEIGAVIGRQSAPILLRNGDEKEGKIHIERPERLKELQAEGYDSAESMVDAVVSGCDAIYKGQRGNLLLVRKGSKDSVLYIRLAPSAHGDYYDVKTAVVARDDFFKNKNPLWERAQTNQPGNGSPLRGLSGQSGSMEAILHQNSPIVKRGYIRFDSDRNFEIGLLKDANLSTFIHESGHFFTEILGDLAERPDAPRQIKEDYAALLTFAGVDSRAHIRTEHHEKLAQAFEAYIMEGRAPSVETRSLFRRMKDWMVGIYKDLTALNVRLTPEVREVFDRMSATDAEIGRIRRMQEMKPLFATAGDAGMHPAEFDRYREDAGQAGELAKEGLLRTLMAEKRRERKPWWRDEQAALRDEATAEAQAGPVYRALQEILKGRDFAGNVTPGLKLDRSVLVRMYGEEFLKRLPKGSATDYLYAVEGGAHPELVAERYGFSSADEMIRAMLAAPPLGNAVAAEAEARMKDRHGDLLRDGRMAGEAMKTVHNDQWAEVLRTEISALHGKGNRDGDDVAAPPVAVFRQAAREQVGAKPVRTIDPLLYLDGGRTAAREALDLFSRGDFSGAAAARTRQLLNHFLYSEAVAALDEVDAIRAEAGRMSADAGSLSVDGVREMYQAAKPPVRLTGKELGDHGDDLAALRKAAVDWYREHLQVKEPAHRDDLGEIAFTRKGRKEVEHFSADPNKLKMVPLLREIIESGDYVREEQPDHPRKDGIVKFHLIDADVEMAGKLYRVQVEVGEDKAGNKFYDLFPDAEEHEQKKASKQRSGRKSPGEPGGDPEGVTTLFQSIAPSFGDVNIRIVHQTSVTVAETGPMADAGLVVPGLAGSPFREQIDALLARFGLADAPLDGPPARREGLRRFLDHLRRDEGIDLPVPAAVLDEGRGVVSYRDLPMDGLRAVSATLHMIGHAAGVVNTVRNGGAGIALGEAKRQLVEQLNASIPAGNAGIVDDRALLFLDRVAERAPEIHIPIIRIEALFERIDGHAVSGPWHDLFRKPYDTAANHLNRVRESIFPAIFDLIKGKGVDRSHGKIFMERLGSSLTKDEIVAIALNCGNERNLDLLMRGGIRFSHGGGAPGLSPDTLREILGHLSADEIAVVNGVWKAIETLKPEMEALVRRQAGTEPVWIETRPIRIANGILEGGYYPIVFDPHYSGDGDSIPDAALPGRMFLRDGMEEVGVGPLSLDLESVVVRHLDRVAIQITFGEFAAQSKRLLKNAVVKEAIVGRLGGPAHKNMLDWVAYMIEQDTLGRDSSRWLENTRRALLTSVFARIVGQKAADAVSDITTSACRAMQNMDVPHVVRGAFEYLRNPVAVHRFAAEASEHMRLLNREIERIRAEVREGATGKGAVMDGVQRWIVESRAGAAGVAAMMVWISGYREAQAKGMDGMEAVRRADEAFHMIPDACRVGDLSTSALIAKAREMAMLIAPALVRYGNDVSVGRRIANQGVLGANPADGVEAFLFGIVAAGILKESLHSRQPDAGDAFLPWFLAHLPPMVLDTHVGEPAGHVEGQIMGEASGQPIAEAEKAFCEAARFMSNASRGKGAPATITAQYLHDLLTGDYNPAISRNPATGILSYRRHQ
ncbi:JAB domain-containing protein [Geobacter sp. AOG2]|uniref:LPD3 domain-containing protein n=1 Tax=Geobacter sp. AOG2 TaxID=1566347 RepID=UPI001CC7878D|nr:JAB domain-containing protein [Geobacter sp. AOG2]GFE61920.1 hypothetical protein AOG2_25080 [Geobacter sp. AOG2]